MDYNTIYEIGIAVPVYRRKQSVVRLIRAVRKEFKDITGVIFCLADDSGDKGLTYTYLQKHCACQDVIVTGTKTNMGQQKALLLAIKSLPDCRYYATVDDDNADNVRLLTRLYEKMQNGYDIAYAVSRSRTKNLFRSAGSAIRDLTFSFLIGTPKKIRVSSLRMMNKKACKLAIPMNESTFYYMSAEIFTKRRPLKVCNVFFNNRKFSRTDNNAKSTYSVKKLIKLYLGLLWHYGIMKLSGAKRCPHRIKASVTD